MSGDGAVIVGFFDSELYTYKVEAFRWTESDGMVGLNFLQNTDQSSASGVSGDGSVIVGRSYHWPISQAFIWTESDGMAGLGGPSGASFDSVALAVSADGSAIVGLWVENSRNEAFRWTAENGMVGLGDLDGGFFRVLLQLLLLMDPLL